MASPVPQLQINPLKAHINSGPQHPHAEGFWMERFEGRGVTFASVLTSINNIHFKQSFIPSSSIYVTLIRGYSD